MPTGRWAALAAVVAVLIAWLVLRGGERHVDSGLSSARTSSAPIAGQPATVGPPPGARAPRPSPGPARAGVLDALAECALECDVACERDHSGRIYCPARCNAPGEACASDEICMPSIGVTDELTGWHCYRSDCAGLGEADNCGPNATCRHYGDLTHSIHRCELAGNRRVGEACLGMDFNADANCAKGLECVDGRCAPSVCTRDDQCPDGMVCSDAFANRSHNGCLSRCSSDEDCGEGWRCLRGEQPHCVLASVPSTCLELGCDAGLECVPFGWFPWRTEGMCLRRCGGDGDCDPDQWCARQVNGAEYCRTDCARSGTCPDGMRCEVDDAGRGLCGRDLEAEIEAFFAGYPTRPRRAAASER